MTAADDNTKGLRSLVWVRSPDGTIWTAVAPGGSHVLVEAFALDDWFGQITFANGEVAILSASSAREIRDRVEAVIGDD